MSVWCHERHDVWLSTGNQIGDESVEHISTFVISSASLATLDLCSVLAFDNGIPCDEVVGLMACCVGLCGQTTVLGMMARKNCVRRWWKAQHWQKWTWSVCCGWCFWEWHKWMRWMDGNGQGMALVMVVLLHWAMCWRVKKQCLHQSASMVCFPFCQSPSFVDVFARPMLCDVCGCGNRKQNWGTWCECVVWCFEGQHITDSAGHWWWGALVCVCFEWLESHVMIVYNTQGTSLKANAQWLSVKCWKETGHWKHCLWRVCGFVESHDFEHEWQVIDGELTDNGISDDGAMELAQSLQHNTILTALYLNGVPQNTCLLFPSNPPFSCIVFVQATTSLMMASVCLRVSATRTHWPCFLFDEWHCPCVGSTALCFSSTAFLMTINDGNTTPTTPFHFSLSFNNRTALAKHDSTSNSSSQWLLLYVCVKRNNQMVSWVHSIIQQSSLNGGLMMRNTNTKQCTANEMDDCDEQMDWVWLFPKGQHLWRQEWMKA